MSHPLNLTIDLYLSRMVDRGEFDNLPGAGKPIENLSEPALSVIDRIMAEADVKPVVVVLNQKQSALRGLLRETEDPDERRAVMREIADIQTRMAIEVEIYNRYR